MSLRNFRIETCAICFDNFEWISLFEDKEYEQVLLALSMHTLEPFYKPEGPSKANKEASSSSTFSSRSHTISFSIADGDSAASSSSSSGTQPPVSKGETNTPLYEYDSDFEDYSLFEDWGVFEDYSAFEDDTELLYYSALEDEGESASSSSSDQSSPRGLGAFSSSITTTFDPRVTLSLGCSLPCDLGHLFCGTCLETYIETQLREGVWPIVCPEHHCDEVIPAVVVESFLGKKANRWYELGVERAVMKQVYCPNLECNKLIDMDDWDFESDTDKITLANSTCPYCSRRFCAVCNKDPHAGKTCKQIEDDTSQKSFDTLATQKGWKQCPGCKFMVEKTAGCNHMTCRCSRQFCYVCPSGTWPCGHSH